MTQKTEVQFVNDWSELESAISELKEILDGHSGCDPDHCDIGTDMMSFRPEAEAIITYVPKLLTQYATLLEMSFELTDLVKEQIDAAPAKGLYLPNHR